MLDILRMQYNVIHDNKDKIHDVLNATKKT